LSARAAAYSVLVNGPEQTFVVPAEPRIPVPNGVKLARTLIGTEDTTTCDQMSNAAWNAACDVASKPVYEGTNVAVGATDACAMRNSSMVGPYR
jgi:hypothetical protein